MKKPSIWRNIRRFKNGFKSGIKQSLGLNQDDKLGSRNYGLVCSSVVGFVLRWLSIAAIFWAVISVSPRVMEWVLK